MNVCQECYFLVPRFLAIQKPIRDVIERYEPPENDELTQSYIAMIVALNNDQNQKVLIKNHKSLHPDALKDIKNSYITENECFSFKRNTIKKFMKMMALFFQKKNGNNLNVADLMLNFFKSKDDKESGSIDTVLHAKMVKSLFQYIHSTHNYEILMISLKDVIESKLIPKYKSYIKTMKDSLNERLKVERGEMILSDFKHLEANLRLGFANWDCFNNFQKWGRFVKMLRQNLHNNFTNEVLHKNLNKKEKSYIRTFKKLVNSKEIARYLDIERYQEKVKDLLYLKVSCLEDYSLELELGLESNGNPLI